MTQPQRKIVGKFTELFLDFMYSMMKLAERPIHQFPNNAIKLY